MSQISALNPADTGLRSATESRFNEMSSEDFIRIIFAELSNQDPFQPNDSAVLLEQLNSIRSIESNLQLTKQIETLVSENQLATASGMIGKFIGGLTEELDRVAGYVVSVVRQGDSINLELDNGWFVPFENVETVIDPSLFEDPIPTAPSEPGPSEPEPSEPVTPSLPDLIDAWGEPGGSQDLNGDGVVDTQDLLELLSQMG